jgi:hypothetical protein
MPARGEHQVQQILRKLQQSRVAESLHTALVGQLNRVCFIAKFNTQYLK